MTRTARAAAPRAGGAIRVRGAVPSDAPSILSLAPRLADVELPRGRSRRVIARATRTFIDRALHAGAPTECFLIAENAERHSLGFAHLRLEHDFFSGAPTAHIANLAVAARHEGEGAGLALLRAAQRWARAQRCTQLSLSVFPGNARALALYARAGFAPELIRMTKPLRHVRRGSGATH